MLRYRGGYGKLREQAKQTGEERCCVRVQEDNEQRGPDLSCYTITGLLVDLTHCTHKLTHACSHNIHYTFTLL